MGLRRLPATLLAVGVSTALLAAGTAVAVAETEPSTAGTASVPVAAVSAADKPVTVTLITGDRVTVSSRGIAYEHAPGRAGIRSLSWTANGHQYVVPADALPLLQQKRLDQRLFDVTTLRDFGYTGDAALPLLLAYPKSGGPAGARTAVRAPARVDRDLTKVRMLAVHASRTARVDFWTGLTRGTATARALRPGIERVYLDGKLRPSLDVSTAQVGAPAAWQQGLDGTGVTVAVLDTGIDATHPDFAGKIVASRNFTSTPSTDDTYGHGTHVASIIAGSGAKSGGRYKGVAPGAKLAVGKVCDGGWCDESAVLAGMQWAAPTAPVVNMSLGYIDTPDIDPLEQAVNDLTATYGALFVIAAGNRGASGSGTVDSPASADSALAVGAVDSEDQLAAFSARGPRLAGGMIKPDITAPGVGITAARAANGRIGDPAPDGYTNMDGTSMAAPHVAGAAAIVTQLHPGWSARQRKTLLMGAANPTAGVDVLGQGAGRLDVARAVHQTVSVDEGSLDFGQQEWPHDDDTPVTRTLTYRNGGTAPITLALAAEGETGVFSLAATSLTVPAGGTATTTVTADTRGPGPDGVKSGRVVATAPGDVRVETPMAVDRDVEKHHVTIRHVGRDGQPNLNHYAALIPLDTRGRAIGFWDYSAEQTDLVPTGTYGLFSEVDDADGTATLLVRTKLVVDGDQTLTLDARDGRPLKITPPRSDARQATAVVGAYWTAGGGTAGVTTSSAKPGDTFLAQVGPAEPVNGFYGSVNSVFARWKNDDEQFRDSPYTYETAYFRAGAFYTGFDKRIDPAKLVAVKSRYAADAAGAVGVKYNWPYVIPAYATSTVGTPFALPFERTEYLNTDGSARWRGEFEEQVGQDTVTRASGTLRQFQAGPPVREDWNHGVFAPTVGDDLAVRAKNRITANIPLFSDASGHQGRSLTMDSARTALYAGDTFLGDAKTDHAVFEVPAERRAYRLEMSATRSAPFRLGTSVSGVWTFSSAAGDTVLPLSTVRFRPRLDLHNNAPAGPFTFPVTVDRAPGSAAAPNRTLTAEFSVDDGRTWRPATVAGRTLTVTDPPGGYVSLRVNAVDTAGNTAVVTVIRAYAVG